MTNKSKILPGFLREILGGNLLLVKSESKLWPKFFRYKGVNASQNQPKKPILTEKTAALTAFNQKNSGVNGV